MHDNDFVFFYAEVAIYIISSLIIHYITVWDSTLTQHDGSTRYRTVPNNYFLQQTITCRYSTRTLENSRILMCVWIGRRQETANSGQTEKPNTILHNKVQSIKKNYK